MDTTNLTNAPPSTNTAHALVAHLRARFASSIHFLELGGLVLICAMTVVAMFKEAKALFLNGDVGMTDMLLVFLYLEVLVMVGQYLRTWTMSVQYPLYIAIVAMARDLILGTSKDSTLHLLTTAGGIVLVAAGVLLIRYGQIKYATEDDKTTPN
jgi:protein PsiE